MDCEAALLPELPLQSRLQSKTFTLSSSALGCFLQGGHSQSPASIQTCPLNLLLSHQLACVMSSNLLSSLPPGLLPAGSNLNIVLFTVPPPNHLSLNSLVLSPRHLTCAYPFILAGIILVTLSIARKRVLSEFIWVMG